MSNLNALSGAESKSSEFMLPPQIDPVEEELLSNISGICVSGSRLITVNGEVESEDSRSLRVACWDSQHLAPLWTLFVPVFENLRTSICCTSRMLYLAADMQVQAFELADDPRMQDARPKYTRAYNYESSPQLCCDETGVYGLAGHMVLWYQRDLSDPCKALTMPKRGTHIAVADGVLCIAAGHQIYVFSDGDPQRIVTLPFATSAIAVRGTSLYCSQHPGASQFHVERYDLSTGTCANTATVNGRVEHIAVSGQFVFIAVCTNDARCLVQAFTRTLQEPGVGGGDFTRRLLVGPVLTARMDDSFSSGFAPPVSPSVNDASNLLGGAGDRYYQAAGGGGSADRDRRTISNSSASSSVAPGTDLPPSFANTHLAVSPLSDVAFVAYRHNLIAFNPAMRTKTVLTSDKLALFVFLGLCWNILQLIAFLFTVDFAWDSNFFDDLSPKIQFQFDMTDVQFLALLIAVDIGCLNLWAVSRDFAVFQHRRPSSRFPAFRLWSGLFASRLGCCGMPLLLPLAVLLLIPVLVLTVLHWVALAFLAVSRGLLSVRFPPVRALGWLLLFAVVMPLNFLGAPFFADHKLLALPVESADVFSIVYSIFLWVPFLRTLVFGLKCAASSEDAIRNAHDGVSGSDDALQACLPGQLHLLYWLLTIPPMAVYVAVSVRLAGLSGRVSHMHGKQWLRSWGAVDYSGEQRSFAQKSAKARRVLFALGVDRLWHLVLLFLTFVCVFLPEKRDFLAVTFLVTTVGYLLVFLVGRPFRNTHINALLFGCYSAATLAAVCGYEIEHEHVGTAKDWSFAFLAGSLPAIAVGFAVAELIFVCLNRQSSGAGIMSPSLPSSRAEPLNMDASASMTSSKSGNVSRHAHGQPLLSVSSELVDDDEN